MPTPSAVKTIRAVSALSASAYPSAAPMKGAVQGEAMATASTPERNASVLAWPLRAVAIRAGSNDPNSKRPERLSASARNSTASSATNSGDWSWNPQPISAPSDLSTTRTPAKTQNDARTPNAYSAPWSRIARASRLSDPAKPSTLIDNTGSTQGMRLRINPPRKANMIAAARPGAAAAGAATTTGTSISTACGPPGRRGDPPPEALRCV